MVNLGGIDNVVVFGMSGGWERSFSLASAEQVSVTFRYRMDQSPDYDAGEFSQVMFEIDGVAVGTMGNDHVVQLTGDGNSGEVRTTGWQTLVLDLGVLSSGAHTITIGGYNNQKTLSNEFTTIWIDDVGILTVLPPVCGDGLIGPGEDCDDGGTAAGDCCSPLCGFESAGSPCDDVNACTEIDVCDGAGTCEGDAITCGEPPACTTGSCDVGLGCVFTPVPGCGPAVPASFAWGRALLALMLGLAAALRFRAGAGGGR